MVTTTHEPGGWLADASPPVRDRLTGAGRTHLELDGYSTEKLQASYSDAPSVACGPGVSLEGDFG